MIEAAIFGAGMVVGWIIGVLQSASVMNKKKKKTEIEIIQDFESKLKENEGMYEEEYAKSQAQGKESKPGSPKP